MHILYNARIYTLDDSRPVAAALAVRDGKILAIAEDFVSLQMLDGPHELLDLGGRVLIPGLTDAHIHLEHYALGLQKVDCETSTLEECLHRVAERARTTPPGEWILGHGWNQNNWGGAFPSANQLDPITPHHPVYLTAKSLHAGWANTAALKLAGITAHTPDPVSGQIGRNADGTPNGMLFESAMQLVGEAIPAPSVEQVAEAICSAMPGLWQVGITSVHDFDRSRCFAALQRLHANGQLNLRVVKSIPLDDLPHAAALGLRSGFGDDWLRLGAVKLFADGALGPRTAAMLQPYEGEPENRGMLMLDAEEIFEHGKLAVENGFPLAIHAIGDRANHEVLNALEQLRKLEHNVTTQHATRITLRHRIEHVQLIHPDDASRLAQLGVIASMQPIHATSDMEMADRHWGERAALSYAWKTQLDVGASLAFGSDAPVESPNPWWGLHAAVTRRRQDGTPGPDGWYPEQRLTVADALRGFTVGAAYAAGLENRLGKLASGFLADLLVLDTDPFTCDPETIKNIRPLATMVGGEWVFNVLNG
jgi:predicted amidohydrolase YtcJ